MKTARVLISGFVQGVGYRHFVKNTASKLGLKGWVKNLPDRRVEALFVGTQENIEKAIKECKKGPFLSEVEDVETEWIDSTESFDDFKIVS